MVRKINKHKNKKPKLKIRSTMEIDDKINEFMEIMTPLLGEENISKLKHLTTDNSSVGFMSMIFAVITTTMANVTEESKEIARKQCLEILDKYVKEYMPRTPTLYFCNFFAINKIIHRYFKVNYFKENFKKNNENKIFDTSEYKFFNEIMKTKPIQQTKDRVFVGVWEQKIHELSKRLNNMLKLFNTLRETYIIKDKIIEEYDRVKSSLALSYEDEDKITKKEWNYLRKVFGNSDVGKEILETYKKPTEEKYRTETNIIQDILFYVVTIQLNENLEALRRNLAFVTNNGLFANNVVIEVKHLASDILKFFSNFELLVEEGKDTFDENIKIPFSEKTGELVTLRTKK